MPDLVLNQRTKMREYARSFARLDTSDPFALKRKKHRALPTALACVRTAGRSGATVVVEILGLALGVLAMALALAAGAIALGYARLRGR